MTTKNGVSNSLAGGNTTHNDSNINLTTTPPKSESVSEIKLTGQPVSELWDDLIFDLINEIAASVRSIVDGTHPLRDSKVIANAMVVEGEPTTVEQMIATYLAPGVGGWTEREIHRLVPFLVDAPNRVGVEIAHLCSILRIVDTDQPFIIHIEEGFKTQRKSQREDICQLIASLAVNNEINIVGSVLKQRWLANTHSHDLPGSLISQCNTGHDTHPDEATKQQLVEKAIDKFDPDGGIVEMLRYIAKKPTGSATFDELDAKYDVNRDTIHRRVSELREDLCLLSETRKTDAGNEVGVTSTGRAFLDTVYEESGVQTTFEEALIGSGKCQQNNRVDPQATREVVDEAVEEITQPTTPRPRLPFLHTPHKMPQHQYLATNARSINESITITNTKITDETVISPNDDRASPAVFYDHDERQLVVEAEFDNPLQHTVSVVNALSTPRYLKTILDPDELTDEGVSDFIHQLETQKEFLRQKRCLESLPDEIDTVEEYADILAERGQEILTMTRELSHDEHPDGYSTAEYRGEICRAAIGYIGTIAHILDLVDVEFIEQIKIPNYTKLPEKDRDNLVKMLGKLCSIQSVYKHATTQRQVFEKRPGKRKQMMEVNVDPTNPFSTLVSTFSIVGDFGSKKDDFINRLNSQTFEPDTPHDDAPEIQLKTVVETETSRQQYVEAITSVCRTKNISPTPQAVSTLSAFCNTPYEAAAAVHWLAPNDETRRIDAREVRYGLSQLSADDILADLNGHYIQEVVMELLEASKPVPKSEIADLVGVCDDTVEKYLSTLTSIGVVDRTKTGYYRLNLSYNTDEERISDVYPTYVTDPDRPDVHKAAKALKIGIRHHTKQPVTDEEFPTTAGRKWCLDLREIDDPSPWIEDILPLLWNIDSRDAYPSSTESPLAEVYTTNDEITITIGPEIQPTGLDRFAPT